MVIFYSYVSLPEGTRSHEIPQFSLVNWTLFGTDVGPRCRLRPWPRHAWRWRDSVDQPWENHAKMVDLHLYVAFFHGKPICKCLCDLFSLKTRTFHSGNSSIDWIKSSEWGDVPPNLWQNGGNSSNNQAWWNWDACHTVYLYISVYYVF